MKIPFLLLVSFFFFQNAYACVWEIEVLDTFTKEVKYYRPTDNPSLTINFTKLEEGINVSCVFFKVKEEIKDGAKSSGVSSYCGYPDRQMFHSKAIVITNIRTGEIEN